MRKGFKHLCNGDGSTSTLDQQKTVGQGSSCIDSPYLDGATLRERQPTLEEMILQLELGEAASRRAKLDDSGEYRHRMSCVNRLDILRCARNALNQYPRFSLDGKDAMYRSSFRNIVPPSRVARNSLSQGSSRGYYTEGFDSKVQRLRELPDTIAGENVVWCSPGVVAKLMGLEAMPVPVQRYPKTDHRPTRHNLRRRARKVDEISERTRLVLDTNVRRGASLLKLNQGILFHEANKGGTGSGLPSEQFIHPIWQNY